MGCASITTPVGTIQSPIVARDFAGPQTYMGPMPSGIVLLTGTKDDPKNIAFCQAYMSYKTPQLARGTSIAAANVIVTWFPLADPQNTALDPTKVSSADCPTLLAHYNFPFAQQFLANFKNSAGKVQPITGVGPFVALIAPDTTGLEHAAVSDGSSVAQSDIGAFATDWLDKLQQTQAAANSSASSSSTSLASLIHGGWSFFVTVVTAAWPGVGAAINTVVGWVSDAICKPS